MSLPTYIKRRRIHNPAFYLAEKLAKETGRQDVGFYNRIMQVLKQWEKDFDGYYINPAKRHVRPYWLLPRLEEEQELALGAAGSATDEERNIQFLVDTQGHFEICYAMFFAASNDFVVEIMDGGNNNKKLMNTEIHARTIAGSARKPFIWPESYFLSVQDAPRTINMNFRNLSAAANTIRWAFHGRRWFHKEADPETQRMLQEKFGLMEKTYTYFLTTQPLGSGTPEGANPPAITLAANQALVENAAPVFISTDEADFEAHKLTYFATGAFEFQLIDVRSGRSLSNGWVRVTTGWGDGEFPFMLPETLLIERNYRVQFWVRDLSNAENRVYPVLVGRRMQYA